MSKRTKKVLIGFVLDESGSMATAAEETVQGTNAFMDENKNAIWFAHKFEGNNITAFAHGVPGNRVERLKLGVSYNPGGNTPLYDAVGLMISKLDAEVEGDTSRKVTLVIQTDGWENASREFDFKSISKLLEDRQGAGWQVIFLAQGLDAVELAKQSFGDANAMNFSNYSYTPDPSSVAAVMTSAAGAARSYGETGVVNSDDFDVDESGKVEERSS